MKDTPASRNKGCRWTRYSGVVIVRAARRFASKTAGLRGQRGECGSLISLAHDKSQFQSYLPISLKLAPSRSAISTSVGLRMSAPSHTLVGMFARSLFALAFSTAALATPFLNFQGCSVPSSVLQLPKNQTALTAPSTSPTFVTLGVGVQNYTCSNTSTYTNVGALAELFDISCLYSTSLFPGIQDIAFAAWSALPADATTLEVERILRIVGNPDVVGQHYFVTSPSDTGTSPKFDFTSGKFNGNANAYILAARAGDLPSPDSKSDVDWLSLNRVSGELADQVFRVDTRGGQPPASCIPGSPEISVRYVARYLFYGGSIKS